MAGGNHGGAEASDPIIEEYIAKDKVAWYKKPNLRALYFILLPTCMGIEITSGFDSSMMNGLQAVTYWQTFFNDPADNLLGLMSSAYSLGAMLSLPVVPFFVDGLGRKKAITVGSSIMVVGAALQAASVNYAMFVVSRAVLGFGIPMCIVSASSLIGELSYPKERPIMTSLFNASWFVGSIIAAAITLGTFNMASNWSWRIPSLLQCVPSFVQLAFIYFVPESPRWLISRGRGAEAYATLAKYHAEGDHESPLVKAEYAQIESTLKLEAELAEKKWTEIFRTPGLRRRSFISAFLGLFTQWSGNGMISYYLRRILNGVGITDNRTINYINLSHTIWGFVNGTTIALLVRRFPRRVMYLVCTISLLSVYTTWTIGAARYTIAGDAIAGRLVLAMIFVYSPAYNIGYNALTYTYLVELWPFSHRARGIAWFQLFGRLAGFLNQYVNPIGINRAGWRYYLSYVIWLAFEIVFVYFFFPETSGRTLEELAFIFEGDEIKRRQTEGVQAQLDGTSAEAGKVSPSLEEKQDINQVENK